MVREKNICPEKYQSDNMGTGENNISMSTILPNKMGKVLNKGELQGLHITNSKDIYTSTIFFDASCEPRL